MNWLVYLIQNIYHLVTTKERIIVEATQYFNQEGFGGLSFLEIAKRLKMSRGNLAYHFKSKEDLLEAISKEMWRKIDNERQKSRALPSFENLHNWVQLYYRFQKAYSFIFLDYHVLNHPVIKPKFRELTKEQIKDNEATIAFSISAGNMKPEPFEGMYHNLAFNTWMVSFYWLNQQKHKYCS